LQGGPTLSSSALDDDSGIARRSPLALMSSATASGELVVDGGVIGRTGALADLTQVDYSQFVW
jgi:hypothetical protein